MTTPTDPTPRPYIVILYGGPSDTYCDLNACPVAVHGPFPNRERANDYAGRLPDGFRPHILPVDDPMPLS
jgi:hypothetical protein